MLIIVQRKCRYCENLHDGTDEGMYYCIELDRPVSKYTAIRANACDHFKFCKSDAITGKGVKEK